MFVNHKKAYFFDISDKTPRTFPVLLERFTHCMHQNICMF